MNIDEKVINETLMKIDRDTSAAYMAELLMDDQNTSYKMFEEIASSYINGNDDVKKGINLACATLTGYNIGSIAMKLLEDYNKHDPIVRFTSAKSNTLDEIVTICDDMNASDELEVDDFGLNKDLILHICKDSEYKVGDEYNMVSIITHQLDDKGEYIAVDDTGDVYVTDGSLLKELERIYKYYDLQTL